MINQLSYIIIIIIIISSSPRLINWTTVKVVTAMPIDD